MNVLGKTALAGVAAFLVMQLVPYGKDHTNPPVVTEPTWSSPEIRLLAKKACFDCHSHETVWPAYAKVAPFSWLISYDISAARKKLNFSHWQNGKKEGEDAVAIAHEITKGEMPPFRYVIAHPDAKLSADDKKKLIEGLQKTFGK